MQYGILSPPYRKLNKYRCYFSFPARHLHASYVPIKTHDPVQRTDGSLASRLIVGPMICRLVHFTFIWKRRSSNKHSYEWSIGEFARVGTHPNLGKYLWSSSLY